MWPTCSENTVIITYRRRGWARDEMYKVMSQQRYSSTGGPVEGVNSRETAPRLHGTRAFTCQQGFQTDGGFADAPASSSIFHTTQPAPEGHCTSMGPHY